MAASTPVTTHPPEVNAGVTTSWLPMSTPWVSIAGCESSFWKVIPTVLAGWDPGYGTFVQQGLSCHPPQVTTWWDENHLFSDINTQATLFSLGPVVCPQAYSTVRTSVNDASSTFVACCPSGYSFVDFHIAGDTGECVSKVTPNQVIQFATFVTSSISSSTSSGWSTSTSTVQTASVAYGIPVNGWLFPVAAATGAAKTTGGGTTGGSPTGTLQPQTDDGSSSGLSTGAKVGIGVGVPLGILALAGIGIALYFYRKARKPPPQPEAAPAAHNPMEYYKPPAEAMGYPSPHQSSYYDPQTGHYQTSTQSPPPPSELPNSPQERHELPVTYHMPR